MTTQPNTPKAARPFIFALACYMATAEIPVESGETRTAELERGIV